MKLGLIGCGKQALKHIKGIQDQGGLEIVVYDSNKKAAAQIAQTYNTDIAQDLDVLLEDDELNGVIIASPTRTHFDFIEKSLKSKKHVFCEKPLCETFNQASLLHDLSLETGCFIQVGYVYRQVAAFQELKKLLNSAENPLGDITFAHLRLGGRGDHASWKHQKEFSGGAIREMLVHMLDLSTWLFGEITDINHFETHLLRPERMINGKKISADAEDFVSLSGFTHQNNYISLQADLLTPIFSQFVEVQGTNGSFFGSIQVDKPSHYYLINNTETFMSGKQELVFQNRNLFSSQMSEFIHNINQGKLNHAPGVLDSIYLFKLLEQLHDKKNN